MPHHDGLSKRHSDLPPVIMVDSAGRSDYYADLCPLHTEGIPIC